MSCSFRRNREIALRSGLSKKQSDDPVLGFKHKQELAYLSARLDLLADQALAFQANGFEWPVKIQKAWMAGVAHQDQRTPFASPFGRIRHAILISLGSIYHLPNKQNDKANLCSTYKALQGIVK